MVGPRKKKTDADTLKSPVLSFKYDRKQVPQYGPREVDAFLAARLPSSYAITERVLREIQTRSPGFNPKSLLDFGCGPGQNIQNIFFGTKWKPNAEFMFDMGLK